MNNLNIDKKQKLFLPSKYLIDKRNNFFLLYDWQNHNWIIVNQHGKEIINLIENGQNINEIVAKISSKYGISLKQSSEKVNVFIDYLLNSKFVFTQQYKCDQFPSLLMDDINFSCSVLFDDCNLDCVYCYNKINRKEIIKKTNEMSTTEFIYALNEIINFGVKQIMFSGGEPTLRDDLDQLIEFIKRKNDSIYVALITNGTRITQKNAKKFSRICDLIWVSLDSYYKEEHERLRGKNTFQKTVNTIKLLVKEKANLLVNAMISDFNYKSIKKTRDFILKELGSKKFRMSLFQPFKSIGKAPDGFVINPPPFVFDETKLHYNDIISYINTEDDLELVNSFENIDPIPKRIHCGVGHGEFSLHANGDIYPCQSLTDEKFKCGNILKENLSEIYYQSPIMKKCRNLTVDKIEKCKDCEVKFICCGGCRASAYEIYGELDANVDIFCQFNKRKALDRLWNGKMVPFKDVNKLKEKYSKLKKQ